MTHNCTKLCPLYPLPADWTHTPRAKGHSFKLKGHPGVFTSIIAVKRFWQEEERANKLKRSTTKNPKPSGPTVKKLLKSSSGSSLPVERNVLSSSTTNPDLPFSLPNKTPLGLVQWLLQQRQGGHSRVSLQMALQRLTAVDNDHNKKGSKGVKTEAETEEEEEDDDEEEIGSGNGTQTAMVLGCTGNGKSYTLNMIFALTRMLLYDVEMGINSVEEDEFKVWENIRRSWDPSLDVVTEKKEDDFPFILPTKLGITCTAQTYCFSYSYIPSLFVSGKTSDDIRQEIQSFLDDDEDENQRPGYANMLTNKALLNNNAVDIIRGYTGTVAVEPNALRERVKKMSEDEHTKKIKAWLGELSELTSKINKTSFHATRASVREVLKEQGETKHKLKSISGSMPCSVFLPQLQLADIPGTNDVAAFNLSRTLMAIRSAEAVILLAKNNTLDEAVWNMLVQSDFLKKLCDNPDKNSLIVVVNMEYQPRDVPVEIDDITKDYDTEQFKEYIRHGTMERLSANPELANRAQNIQPLILPLYPKLFASMHLSSDFELANVTRTMQLSLQEAKRKTNFPALLGAIHELQIKKRLGEVKLLENWLDIWDDFNKDVSSSQDKKKYDKESVDNSVKALDAVCESLREKLEQHIPELKKEHDAKTSGLIAKLQSECKKSQASAFKEWKHFSKTYMYDNKSALAVWKPFWREGKQTLVDFFFPNRDNICTLLEQFVLLSFELSRKLNEITLQQDCDDYHEITRLEKRLRECKLDSLEKDLSKEIRTEAVLQKVSTVINQALQTNIYSVKKKGFQSRVSVIADIVDKNSSAKFYKTVTQKLQEIANDISRFIDDYMAKFKTDVEDIFSEFKLELKQALSDNQAPVNPVDEEFATMIREKSQDLKALMPDANESTDNKIERLTKVGERILGASTNGLLIDLCFSQYYPQTDYVVLKPKLFNPKQLHPISMVQFLENKLPGSILGNIKDSVITLDQEYGVLEALSVMLFSKSATGVVENMIQHQWLHSGHDEAHNLSCESLTSCLEAIQIACDAFKMTVVVVVDEKYSILLTSEYVNNEEAYILHVITSSLKWSPWIWKSCNNNDSDNINLDDSGSMFVSTTTTTTTTTSDKKRKLSFTDESPSKRNNN